LKVRILSGNQTGQVVEQERPEAEANIATGFAEAVVESVPPAVPAIPAVAESPERPRDRRERARKSAEPEDEEDE
jgi:hypothetical protein